MIRFASGHFRRGPVSDYVLRWLICLITAGLDALGLWMVGIAPDPTLPMLGAIVAWVVAVGCLFLFCVRYARATRRWFGAIAESCLSLGQFFFFIVAAGVFSYICASAGFPLVDHSLATFDTAIGFDRAGMDAWFAMHPAILSASFAVYLALFPLLFAVMLVNSAFGGAGANGPLLWSVFLCALATTAISAVLPAIGYTGSIGHHHIEVLESVRAGTLTALTAENADGIVTFPSFHAALAMLIAYDTRRLLWTRVAVWPICVGIILSTPLCGGHYVADTIAGSVLALMAIAAIRAKRSLRRSTLNEPYGVETSRCDVAANEVASHQSERR